MNLHLDDKEIDESIKKAYAYAGIFFDSEDHIISLVQDALTRLSIEQKDYFHDESEGFFQKLCFHIHSLGSKRSSFERPKAGFTKLGIELRSALFLKHKLDLSIKDCSEIMGISEASFSSYLFQGREFLLNENGLSLARVQNA